MIGVDIGKDVFHLVGFSADGKRVLQQKIKRLALKTTFESLPRCVVGMEACLSAHFVRVLLENYFLPGQLEAAVGAFVDHYNHRRYHESLGNLTPAEVYFGRGQAILEARDQIKKLTIRNRRLSHHGQAA